MSSFTVAGLPGPLGCSTESPAPGHSPAPGIITLTARARDDLFADPGSDTLVMTASMFTFEAEGDFQFRARVLVDFVDTYDSGVLIGYLGPRRWFKICAELDPAGVRRIVTVVTEGLSDDANGSRIIGEAVHLRISRTGRAVALHSSEDGSRWSLARYFALTGDADLLQLGIAAQSPAGSGTRATFSEFGWVTTGLASARDGS